LYDKAACNVHTNNVGSAFFWKNNLVAFGIPVGRSSPKAGKKRRANDSAKQTRNKNPALFGAKPITVFFSFLCCFP